MRYLRDAPHGYCERCGFKYYQSDLSPDPDMPGMYVCTDCVDEQHPQKFPVDTGGPESVLDLVLPPNHCDNCIVAVGHHSELTSLSPVLTNPSLVRVGAVEAKVTP